MSHPVRYSYFGASHLLTRRPIRPPGSPPRPFWCEVTDTPWTKTMKNQIVAATLVSGPGVARTWRFCSQSSHGC